MCDEKCRQLMLLFLLERSSLALAFPGLELAFRFTPTPGSDKQHSNRK
jgi:hypothetical protein